jgi:subfamily B ATP-binding cassette protein MsbA
VRRATRIAVIESGRITEMGTHEELLQQSGTYRRLYDMQFSDEDIAPARNGEMPVSSDLGGLRE